ncbi:hypothetical protein SEA_EWALD_55 [Gordonia phage Ewald]|nr:hypothetical protein SEA_EWALD_55 [Gordonia phage Ewald]
MSTTEARRFGIRFDPHEVAGVAIPASSIEVVLYFTTDQMQEATRRSGIPAAIAREVGGAFTFRNRDPHRGHLGVMRLARDTDDLGSVVTHECVHAAVRAAKWIYGVAELRLNDAKRSEREEIVAWLTGVYADGITRHLESKGEALR